MYVHKFHTFHYLPNSLIICANYDLIKNISRLYFLQNSLDDWLTQKIFYVFKWNSLTATSSGNYCYISQIYNSEFY